MVTYEGQTIALLTQHGKESVIAPALDGALGCKVVRVPGFDTDSLGTFTGERARAGTQLEAARRKARIGMALSGLSLGLGSEGSFGPDPFAAMFSWNVELLVLIDVRHGLEVVGTFQGAAHAEQLRAGQWEEAEAFALRVGFPHQGLVLRAHGAQGSAPRKDIAGWGDLEQQFAECAAEVPDGTVLVDTDLRAFAHPMRMQHIGLAAQDLARRLQSHCPACTAPGWAVTLRHPGLPCGACAMPTRAARSEDWTCVRCSHRENRPSAAGARADPRHCERCNP